HRCAVAFTRSSRGLTRLLPSFPTRRSSDLGGRLCRASLHQQFHVPARRIASARARRTRQVAGILRARLDRRVLHGRNRPCARCRDRKSTRLNSSHVTISYAVFCSKTKKNAT